MVEKIQHTLKVLSVCEVSSEFMLSFSVLYLAHGHPCSSEQSH